MKEKALLAISLCISLAGVGFMYYESGRAEPDPLSEMLGGQVADYVVVEGVVSRYREKNGNIFIAVRGEAEVEVPLFYGVAKELDIVPSLGDVVEVRGMLSAVEPIYMRPYWPEYQILVEAPEHVRVIGKAAADNLKEAPNASLWNAGMKYEARGIVGEIREGSTMVGGVPLSPDPLPRTGDAVIATVLLIEKEGALDTTILDISVETSVPVGPSVPSELGAAYHVEGRVTEVRAYYSGVRICLSDDSGDLHVYCPDIVDTFCGDMLTARGVLRTYYGSTVLYAASGNDVAVTGIGEHIPPDSLESGGTYVLYCTVTHTEYKGNHPIYTLDTVLGTVYAHLYAKERDNLERRGKTGVYFQEGVTCYLQLEITSIEGVPTGKILDYR